LVRFILVVMNLKTVTSIVLSTLLLVAAFFAGFFYGNRERVNSQPPTVEVTAANLARRNSLSDIRVLDIWGAVSTQKKAGFGQLYYKTSLTQTEILVRLQNVPLTILGNNQKISLPNSLSIKIARRTNDGLNYSYETIGQIMLDEPVNGLRAGEFSTILDYSINDLDKRVERIMFYSADTTINNIFLDDDPNLPVQVRREPAPFFWVVL